MLNRTVSLCLLVATACTGDSTPTDPVDPPSDSDTDIPTPTGHTGVEVPTVDCTVLPVGPFSGRQLNAPRGYHGIAFDQLGGLVGSDNTNLVRATSTDDAEILAANFGSAQQMDYLPGGDLIVVGGDVRRVTPEGVSTTLVSGVGAYGVDVGPDGMIYTANEFRIDRIDPDTGASTVFVGHNEIGTPKVLNFNRDGTEMYVGTNSSNGAVYRVMINPDGTPELPPTLIANTGGSWHDGLGVDACGNLYVNEFWTSTLYRIQPDGTVESLINFDNIGSSAYGHGNAWGSGVGNWDDHKLYVPQPYGSNRVGEIDLGIPSKDYNGGVYEIIE